MIEETQSSSLTNLRKLIIRWDNQFPLDNWYRKKYNIPFGSKQHRELLLSSIRFEYEENILLEKSVKKHEENNKIKEEYEKTGIFLKSQEIIDLTDDEIDDVFDNLDLTALNKNIINEAQEIAKERGLNFDED